jgi:lipoprotein-anchoring transpeptidase ErfK/SrfK
MNAVRIPQPISISTVKACTLLLLSAISLSLATDTASAQSATWEDGRPVFRSEGRSSVSTPGMGLWGEDEDSSSGRFPTLMSGGARPYIAPEAPGVVSFASSEPAGTILIDTAARRLYYTLPNGKAYQYPISVGREGFTWTGVERISRVVDWPDWHPPAEMRQRQPELPKKMTGGIRNPLGARALYLGSTLYRIHGTNDARTIGQAASSGCFRMMNEHVMHLSRVAGIGTVVKVVRRLPNRQLAGTGTQG